MVLLVVSAVNLQLSNLIIRFIENLLKRIIQKTIVIVSVIDYFTLRLRMPRKGIGHRSVENVELWDCNPVSIQNRTQISRTLWS